MLGVDGTREINLPLHFLNSLLRVVEKRDKRSSRTIAGIVQCGGVHVEWTYIFG